MAESPDITVDYIFHLFLQPAQIPWIAVIGFCGVLCAVFWFIQKKQREIRWIQKEHESMEVQLRTLEQAQNHLFLNISHEIRTPLNGVLGFSDLIQAHSLRCEMLPEASNDLKQFSKKVQNYVESLRQGTHQLLTVIDRLSEVSHVAAGGYALPVKRESVNDCHIDLVSMIRRILETIKPELDKKKLHVQYTTEGESSLVGQAELLHQAIYQVIENAIKFTPMYGHIQIATFVQNGKATLRVRDTGCGIADSHVPFVKHPMGMPADIAIDGRGVGIGLSLADQIMKRLQGTMHLLTKEGKGTEVTLVFPLAGQS